MRGGQLTFFLLSCPHPILAGCHSAKTTALRQPDAGSYPAAGYSRTLIRGGDLGPISPYVYGSNYGPWTSRSIRDDGLRPEFTYQRSAFPGRKLGRPERCADYQIDTFMAFCKQMGAMPTFSVRLLDGTPEAAAEMVRYTNIEKKYGVVYWAIGNEPDLYYKLAASSDYDTHVSTGNGETLRKR